MATRSAGGAVPEALGVIGFSGGVYRREHLTRRHLLLNGGSQGLAIPIQLDNLALFFAYDSFHRVPKRGIEHDLYGIVNR